MRYLTKIEFYLARWLFKRVVRQGYTHQHRITEVMVVLIDEFQKEFTEDNTPTQVEFLQECFNDAVNIAY